MIDLHMLLEFPHRHLIPEWRLVDLVHLLAGLAVDASGGPHQLTTAQVAMKFAHAGLGVADQGLDLGERHVDRYPIGGADQRRARLLAARHDQRAFGSERTLAAAGRSAVSGRPIGGARINEKTWPADD